MTHIDSKKLPHRKGKMAFLNLVLPSCSASQVYLFHHPFVISVQKLELMIPLN